MIIIRSNSINSISNQNLLTKSTVQIMLVECMYIIRRNFVKDGKQEKEVLQIIYYQIVNLVREIFNNQYKRPVPPVSGFICKLCPPCFRRCTAILVYIVACIFPQHKISQPTTNANGSRGLILGGISRENQFGF